MHKCTETHQKPHPQAVQHNKKLQKSNKKTRKTTAAPKEQKNRISHPPQTNKTKSTNPTSADCQNTYHNRQQQYYKKAQKQCTTQ